MKILHFDILEGFKKGGITQFENDNLNETYKIYLYKNKMRFDVDGKTIRFIMLDKNKAGQVLTLRKGEASNEIILPVTKELTKIDGVYDVQIIFTKEDGYNEKTIPFKITIKNDLLTDMEAELVSKEEYQYLVDRFEEAVRNIEGFKTEIRDEYSGLESNLNNKYDLFKDEINNSNETFKNETNNSIVSFEEEINNSNESFKNTINSTVNSIDEKVNSFDSKISKNTKEIDDAKDEYDTLKARLDRENEKVYETINSKDFLPFEGENVTVEHSKVGFTKDMVVEGRIYQNLIKNSNVKKTIGHSTETQAKYNASYILKQNATYTVVFTIENKTDANPIQVSLNNGYTSKSISVINGINSITLSTDEQGVLNSLWFYYTASIANGAGEVGNILLLEGEQKYIPAYFEGIKSVGEKESKISILSTGKNLFNNKEFCNTLSNKEYYEAYGNTLIVKKIDTRSTGFDYIKKINKNTNYFLSCEELSSRRIYLSKDKTNWTSATFSTYFNSGENEFVTFKFVTSSFPTNLNVMLEEGEKATNYEPYKEDKKEILLPIEDGLKGLPNGACDTIENREDGIYLVQRVYKEVFDGSDNENWGIKGDVKFEDVIIFRDLTYQPGKFNTDCKIISDRFNRYDNPAYGNFEGIRAVNTSSYGMTIGIVKSKLTTQDATGFKAWLQSNPVTVYYELATPIETKLNIPSLNLEAFKDITHVLSENSISPNFKFKAAVNVPATISTLRTRNKSLEQENKELKEEVGVKTLKLHEQDVELTNSDLDLDFRIFELEMSVGLPINLNMKGMRNMARSPFEMMKILILNNNYDREDIEYKASRYLKGGRMSQAEYNETISLMDANEVIQ